MATWEDVSATVSQLPEVQSRGNSWSVKGKSFAWERPLRKRDLEELGAAAPEPPILATWVEDKLAKEALISSAPDVYFTTSHFDGYAIVLARLSELETDELDELLVEAWLARAPKQLAAEYLAASD